MSIWTIAVLVWGVICAAAMGLVIGGGGKC
jgi:hypothetical protein